MNVKYVWLFIIYEFLNLSFPKSFIERQSVEKEKQGVFFTLFYIFAIF